MNLQKKLIATTLSVAILFSVMVPASASATDKAVVNNKPVAVEESKATLTVNESTVKVV